MNLILMVRESLANNEILNRQLILNSLSCMNNRPEWPLLTLYQAILFVMKLS